MSSYKQAHRNACEQGKSTYIDPISGYQVFTENALLAQGQCCGNACRHCPYGHINVNKPNHQPRINSPIIMGNKFDSDRPLDVLFWSGGKDSFLCLMHLLNHKHNVVLLTTFGAQTNLVSLQNIHIKDIAKQAEFFGVPLCLVPLHPQSDYFQSVQEGFVKIEKMFKTTVKPLYFGDLHLEDLRQWRLQTWSAYEVVTPLFGESYASLQEQLWRYLKNAGLEVRLSTDVQLKDGVVQKGSVYDDTLIECLRLSGVDEMLENGEGHTMVVVPSLR